MANPPDSSLTAAVRRLEQAIVEGIKTGGQPFGTCKVEIRDVQTLFAALKRFGARKDWEPTWPNIYKLPLPVQLHIHELHRQITMYQRDRIEFASYQRKVEEILARLKNPPR